MHKEVPEQNQGGQLSPNAEEDRLIEHHEKSQFYMVVVDGTRTGSRIETSRNTTFLEKSRDSGAIIIQLDGESRPGGRMKTNSTTRVRYVVVIARVTGLERLAEGSGVNPAPLKKPRSDN